jgi:hypothetical protein
MAVAVPVVAVMAVAVPVVVPAAQRLWWRCLWWWYLWCAGGSASNALNAHAADS